MYSSPASSLVLDNLYLVLLAGFCYQVETLKSEEDKSVYSKSKSIHGGNAANGLQLVTAVALSSPLRLRIADAMLSSFILLVPRQLLSVTLLIYLFRMQISGVLSKIRALMISVNNLDRVAQQVFFDRSDGNLTTNGSD